MGLRRERCLVLVDGEHYPPVIVDAVRYLKSIYEWDIVGGFFLGGTEKIGRKEDLAEELGMPLILRDDMLKGLEEALDTFSPQVVFDLSDEPVVGYRQRFHIASLLMSRGVCYRGADFRFDPPERPRLCEKPCIMVAGSGKRVGKTAVGAYVARVLKGRERALGEGVYEPCIVTMGRGGPAEPEMIAGDRIEMTPEYFLEQSRMGKHAASDHFEDAIMSRVRTIGCRRCGGGFSGRPFYSIVKEGAELANSFDNDIVIFEGSGATDPPVHTDTCIMVIGAGQPEDYVSGYMGPYKVRMADLVVLTMCEEPAASPEKVERMYRLIKEISPSVNVVKTVFRPEPLKKIAGRKAVFCTTAPREVGGVMREHLGTEHGAEVVGITHSLSNRALLKEELSRMFRDTRPEVLLTEVKAASIDVATCMAVENSIDVVYVDNVPKALDDADEAMVESVIRIAALAESRFSGEESA